MRNIFKLLTLSAAAVSLAGCTYGGLGGLGYNSGYGYNGYGSPYGYNGYGSPYGYGGSGVSVSVGYGSGYGSPYGYGYSPYGYGSRYGYGYGSPYGGYYGSPYFGWYNNSYYPGTGIYVYDSYRRPRVWSDAQRVYWTNQKRAYESATAKSGQRTPRVSTNWSGFSRDRTQSQSAPARVQRERTAISDDRSTQRQVRQSQRTTRTERAKTRSERRDRRDRRDDD